MELLAFYALLQSGTKSCVLENRSIMLCVFFHFSFPVGCQQPGTKYRGRTTYKNLSCFLLRHLQTFQRNHPHMACGGIEPTIRYCHQARPFRSNPLHRGNMKAATCWYTFVVLLTSIHTYHFHFHLCNVCMCGDRAVWSVGYSVWPCFALIAGVLLY